MRSVLALSALLIASGCGAGDDSTLEHMERRLTLVPELRVGSVDDPETALTYARAIVIDSESRIYSLHPEENRIRIHTATGEPAGFIGGPGDGPGEFRSVAGMGWVADTLWVLDFGTYRFSYFDRDGTLLRSEAIPIELGSSRTGSPPRPEGLLSDGTIYGGSPAWSSEVAAGNITENAVLRLDRRSQPIDTLYVMSMGNTTWAIEDPQSTRGFGSYGSQPFSDTDIIRHSPTSADYLLVRRKASTVGEEATFSVARISFAGDTLFSREYPYRPLPVDGALVDSLIGARGKSMETIAQRMPGAPTRARAEELARESLYLPPSLPPVSQLLLGRDGTIWLQRENTGDGTRDWLVLSADGNVIGTVAMPASLRPMAAEQGSVWGMETDELDVPYLVRYGVREGDGVSE